MALARSLVVEPSILLLDEPLSNLDAKLRERMRSELKSLQRRTGITFIYVTHDQAEAMALSDRIAVFHQRQGAAGRLAARRLRAAGESLRRRLHGQVNQARRHGVGADGDRAVVEVGEHRLTASDARRLPRRRCAIVAIRPEAIRFRATPRRPEATIELKGVVVEATFLGNIVDYQVDIGGG